MKENNVPKLKCILHPYAYDDPYYFDTRIDEDINSIKDYFKSKRRSYVTVTELQCLNLLIYYDKIRKENNVGRLFFKSHKLVSEEHQELKNNFVYLLNKLNKDKVLNLSLYLWNIYKTYHYFKKINEIGKIDESEFELIEYLFDFAFIFFNTYKFKIVEGELIKEELGFIRHLSALLANDLIRTIENNFPDYYFTNIMFLGYGCHIPGGCSNLTTSMDTFTSFLKGICDYDYWYDEDIIGKELLLKRIKIKKDYDKLVKGLKVDAVI